MERKGARIALRLTDEELGRVERIAHARGCSLSEAVRLTLRGTQVKTIAIHEIEITPPESGNLVLA